MSLKKKQAVETNTIDRILTYSEQAEQKREALGIEEILDETVTVNGRVHNVVVFKQKGIYRAFLKLESITNHDYLLEQDLMNYNSELYSIIAIQKLKFRILTKKINMEDYDLGISQITKDDEISELFKEDIIEEIENIPEILEYYLEFSNSKLDTLLETISYNLSNSTVFKYFNIHIPTENEMNYLYDEVVLGDVGVVYNEDHIIYNYKQPEQYFVKYLYISDLRNRQVLHYWENLTMYGADVMIDIITTPDDVARKIVNKSLSEMGDLLNSRGGKKIDKIDQQKEYDNLYQVINDILEQTDNLIDIRLVLRFKSKDLGTLNKNINTFKKDNNNLYFAEPLYEMQNTEHHYLGLPSKVIPNITLTQKLFILGAGIAYNTYIQKNGFLMSSKNRSIVLLNRQVHSPSTGQAGFNEAFFGVMGSGKSTWQKTFITQDLLLNAQLLIVDYAQEYNQLCYAFNGEIINIYDGKTIVNPFDVLKLGDFVDYKKVGGFISMLYPQIKNNQAIRTKMENLFKEFEKKVESQSFIDYTKSFKEFNTTCKENEKISQEILDILDNISIQYPFFSGNTNVSLNNKFIVFDFEKVNLDPVLRSALGYLIIFLFTDLMKGNIFKYNPNKEDNEYDQLINYANKKNIDVSDVIVDNYTKGVEVGVNDIRKLKKKIEKNHPKLRLMIDEAHNFMREPDIVEEMLRIVKEGRKHNAGITFSTQTPDEMYRTIGQRQIFQLTAYKYYLKQNDRSALTTIGEHGGNAIPESIITYLLSEIPQGVGYLNLNEVFIPIGTNLSHRMEVLFDGGVGEDEE